MRRRGKASPVATRLHSPRAKLQWPLGSRSDGAGVLRQRYPLGDLLPQRRRHLNTAPRTGTLRGTGNPPRHVLALLDRLSGQFAEHHHFGKLVERAIRVLQRKDLQQSVLPIVQEHIQSKRVFLKNFEVPIVDVDIHNPHVFFIEQRVGSNSAPLVGGFFSLALAEHPSDVERRQLLRQLTPLSNQT